MTNRIATWNLERAPSARKRKDAQRLMEDLDVDIWVLTETRESVTPGSSYRAIAESEPREKGDADERWVMIWTCLKGGVSAPTSDKQFAACGSLQGTLGGLSIYGTVLPWCGSTWRGHRSAGADAYQAALSAQAKDWGALTTKGNLCVAGDFNQDLAERHYYWSGAARTHLKRTLSECRLSAVTGGSADPVARLAHGAASCIDHICLTSGLERRVASPPIAALSEREGRRISDHPAVLVTLSDS